MSAVARDPDSRPNADELLGYNKVFAASFPDHGLQLVPRRHLAVVACMDSRMDMFQLLGMDHGDAHIIRNAGGVVTDDVIRSLVISQRRLETREILLVHHTDCGLQRVTEDEFKREIEEECGIRPWWAVESFDDPYRSVAQNMRRLEQSPFIVHKDRIRGFVYDVEDGLLREVTRA
ncbi:MAG: beta-class carbonic anhydrase [Actinomycetota bacterium]